MENKEVMVVYKWMAQEGKSEQLKAIYREVESQMKSNEPGALKMLCYFDETSATPGSHGSFCRCQCGGVPFGNHCGRTF